MNIKLGDLVLGRWRYLSSEELAGLLPQIEEPDATAP
jgi:16S rRNA U516 pseudouridylate synthase RsuA-like enzyme